MNVLGLNDTAILYRYLGQSGGKPKHEACGTPFDVRAEPIMRQGFAGKSATDEATLKLFAPPMSPVPSPGDKAVLTDGAAVIISEVQALRLHGAIHHLELSGKVVERE